MIPVLGVPILTRPELLYRMLDTVDVPVGATIVVDNGDVVSGSVAFDRGLRVVRPTRNMGVAASWNAIIKAAPKAPWWAIVNFDVQFAPGDLTKLAEHMESKGGVALLGTFSAFGIDRDAVRRAGLFDENFVPAYFEDNDYHRRLSLAGVAVERLEIGMSHEASSTLRSRPEFREANFRSFPRNHEYYVAKWGGPPGGESYSTPFDGGGDIRAWQLDVDRLADQSWT